ncbi:MAG: NAD-dependent epimerase/dehydratase family protein [Treponema sp.]|nr:NAD-dependent epimerase/dehydratase family protein [Treponema sp.]
MENLLFTGATGFLGSNVIPLLRQTYEVETLALDPNADYNVNLVTDQIILQKKYDVVLHAAGKAHVVPKSEEEIKLFYDINYEGTKKLCNALEKTGVPKSFIFMSTVAVYGCDIGELITEEHSLDGDTPYAKSKIMAERFLQDWCAKNDVILTILRPSLIAGKNPPGNLGAMIKGISSGKYLSIAGGVSHKSVMMACDLANVIPLCEKKGGIFNICDDSYPSFHELEVLISKQLGKKHPPLSIPYCVANVLAHIGNLMGKKAPINSLRLEKIVKSLTFSNEKIKKELGFVPTDVLSNFIIK